MKKTKLLKVLLIPTIGISAMGTVATITTSCGGDKPTTFNDVVNVTANADSTFALINEGENNPDLQYSLNGKEWKAYSDEINIAKNQTLFLKGNNPNGWSFSFNKCSGLLITGNVSISGNVMGLLDNGAKDGDAGNITDIPNENCFDSLFFNSPGITSVSRDFLPATKLAKHCYHDMFFNCTSLTQAPALPATFLSEGCYESMFQGCTSLVNAPALPATKLEEACYSGMFGRCTSLTKSPDLPATTLAEHCYSYMFYNCTSLTSIKIGYTGSVGEAPSYSFYDWVYGIASKGTFYYKGVDNVINFGFPEGWNIDPNW